jgi:hypothetical protein
LDDGVIDETWLWPAVKEFVLKAWIVAAADTTQTPAEAGIEEPLNYIEINGMQSLAVTTYNYTESHRVSDLDIIHSNNRLPAFILLATAIIGGMTLWMCYSTFKIQGYHNSIYLVLQNIRKYRAGWQLIVGGSKPPTDKKTPTDKNSHRHLTHPSLSPLTTQQTANRQMKLIKLHYAESLIQLQDYSSDKVRMHNAKGSIMQRKLKSRKNLDKNVDYNRWYRKLGRCFVNMIPSTRLVVRVSQLCSLLVVFLWYCLFVNETNNHMLDSSDSYVNFVFYGSQLSTEVYTLFYLVKVMSLSPDVVTSAQQHELEVQINKFNFLRDSFIFGTSIGHTRPPISNDVINDIVFGDGCHAFKGSEEYAPCSVFSNQVLKGGIYTATLEFVDLTLEVASSKRTADDELYLKYEEMALRYLIPSTEFIASTVASHGHDEMMKLHDDLYVVAGIALGGLFIMFFAVYRPMLRNVSEMLSHNDSLPLLVPFDIAFTCEGLKRFFMASK